VNVILYQCFYDKSQIEHLDPVFTPYQNLKNSDPLLREYPMWKALYEEYKETDFHWALLSWRWESKTKLEAHIFRDWILSDPGYDMYHIDPFLDNPTNYPNLWMQGERWHPGMAQFCNKLFPKIGLNIKVEKLITNPIDFCTCNYVVGNKVWWGGYLSLLEDCIKIIKEDEELNHYAFVKEVPYNGNMIHNFPFISERLMSLFNVLNPSIKINKFPIQWPNYKRMYGESHDQLVRNYFKRVEEYESAIERNRLN